MRPSALAFGLVAALFVVSCQTAAPSPATPRPTPASPAVRVVTVQRADLASTAAYTGDVRAVGQVVVYPKVSGRIVKLGVDVGSAVGEGDVLAELEHDSLDAQVAQAMAGLEAAQAKLASMRNGPRPESVAQAEANLRVAQERLAALQDGPRTETVKQAEANLDAAKARLAQLKAGPTPEQVQAARLAAIQARNALYSAQTSRDGVCGNAHNPKFMCDSANASVAAAETGSEQAEQQVKVLIAPPTKEAVDQAQAAVTQAEQQLALARNPTTSHDLAQADAAVVVAQQQVALAKQPYTADDLRSAQAGVDQAKAALDLAKLQRRDATIITPIAGVVVDRPLSVGSLAAPTAPILTLNALDVKVAINVEEARLGRVSTGQAARVFVDAFPGQAFPASVSLTGPVVDGKTRTALVELRPDDPQHLLKPGMFAQVVLDTGAKQGVLVVPRSALVDDQGRVTVFTVREGTLRRVDIRTGLTDGDRVEVVDGLTEGQQVAVGVPQDLRDGSAVAAQAR